MQAEVVDGRFQEVSVVLKPFWDVDWSREHFYCTNWEGEVNVVKVAKPRKGAKYCENGQAERGAI